MNNAGTAPVADPDSDAIGSMSKVVPTKGGHDEGEHHDLRGMTGAGQQPPPRTRR
ncbi:MAG TPA: hypothetical protein VM347_10020 [Nonomuraea sp.]|nr:hypothetical protein [Nonomuraea sp.]